MATANGLVAWHFVSDDGCLRFGERVKVEAGQTYKAKGPLVLCSNGMHAADKALDALGYAPGSMICRVRLDGQILRGDDKVCARSRTVLWMADATRTLHEFSAWAAEWILDRLEAKGEKIDPRSRAAILAKRRWLAGEITDQELAAAWAAARDAARAAAWDAARDAAWDAARDAAWAAAWAAAWDAAWAAARAAAWDAAWAAARDAAWDAAWAAARAAAWDAARAAARDAARAAARDELNSKLESMLLALAPPVEVAA